jgi:hypothetical protein
MPFKKPPSGVGSFSASGGNLRKVTFKLGSKTGIYSGTLRLFKIPYLGAGYGGLSVPQLPTGLETGSTSPIITGRADIIRF